MAVHQQGRRHPSRGAEVAPAEIVEVFEIGVFISAPIVEVPPVVVGYVQPAPVVENGAFAPTVTQCICGTCPRCWCHRVFRRCSMLRELENTVPPVIVLSFTHLPRRKSTTRC